jgi:soluble lytic murein transglycosylase-like protein
MPRRPLLRSLAAIATLSALLLVGQAALGRRSSPNNPNSIVVHRGDTLWDLSRSYHVDMNQLAAVNGMRLTDVLLIGRHLHLPGTGQPANAANANSADAPDHPDPKATKAADNPAVNPPKAITPDQFTPAELAQMRSFCATFQPIQRAAGSSTLPAALFAHPERLKLMPVFVKNANAVGIPADLVQAVAWQESGWQNSVVSSANAYGIGQLLPQTAKFVNKLLHTHLDMKKPADNIRLEANFLAVLLRATGGHVCEAVASYYQGFATLRRVGVLPESQIYVANVLNLRSRFR